MLFDMTHKLIVIERLIASVSGYDHELAEKLKAVPDVETTRMPTLSKNINGLLRSHLEGLSDDAELVSRGCHPLSTAENWDAVVYWLAGIDNQYVPALRQAKVNQNEGTTCT